MNGGSAGQDANDRVACAIKNASVWMTVSLVRLASRGATFRATFRAPGLRYELLALSSTCKHVTLLCLYTQGRVVSQQGEIYCINM